ncbi:MAG: DUF7000 family protein [Anaerolineae bacterium]
MQSIQEDMNELRKQLIAGAIQRAYRSLLNYMMGLRVHFTKKYPSFSLSGLYQGYMDMTYFAIVPSSLRDYGLKIAIVFNYEAFRFEAWLSGTNRQVQRKYWEIFRDSQWTRYRVVTPEKGVDSIIECNLAEDLTDFDSLTATIEQRATEFIKDMETLVSSIELG